ILCILIIGLFFAPNLLGDYLLRPALNGVIPGISGAAPQISAWHGFNTELFMTLGIVIVGTLLFLTFRSWFKIYRLQPADWTFTVLYNSFLKDLKRVANWITTHYMTGHLPAYFAYIFIFFIATAGGALLITGALSVDLMADSPISIYEGMLVAVMAVAAVSILFAKSRLTAILLNGVLGFSIAIFFVLFRAPDLALTQLVIETVTTTLFLLCFNFLPEWKKEDSPKRTKIRNALIAIGGGVTVTLIGLTVNSGELFESISGYFEDSYELAGGENIVNAILGDFRAFDTMLESLVLFIAGLGVYTLIRLKVGKGSGKDEHQ